MTKPRIARTFRQRCCVFVAMAVGLSIIIYFAPSVDKTYLSCDRPCHDYDWPMICRVTLTIDNNSCSKKNSSMNDILHSVRNLLPGPTIHVCQNDVVFVTVIKKLPGELKFNWQDSQTANDEGVVIQPANETSILYKFRATYPGTHLWNAFIDNIRFTGAIVVRKSPQMNIEKHFYDVDDRNHTIMLSECNDKNSMLMNGQVENGKAFLVDYGKNYLFRSGYSGTSSCKIKLQIEDHQLYVIAINGNTIVPQIANTITLKDGKRVDFVIRAQRKPKDYKILFSTSCYGKDGSTKMAVLRYVNDLSTSFTNANKLCFKY